MNMPTGIPTLHLKRSTYLPDRVLGWLTVRQGPIQLFRCASLELPWSMNANRISCVPAGLYVIELEYSDKFKSELWELKGVPGRSEVKIHGANYPSELLGCIAPGLFHSDINKDGKLDVTSSRLARERLHEALGDIRSTTISIEGDERDVLKAGMNGYRS